MSKHYWMEHIYNFFMEKTATAVGGADFFFFLICIRLWRRCYKTSFYSWKVYAASRSKKIYIKIKMATLFAGEEKNAEGKVKKEKKRPDIPWPHE